MRVQRVAGNACGGPTNKSLFADSEDARVRLEVHAGGALDRLEAANGDVLLIGEAEADNVQHCRRGSGAEGRSGPSAGRPVVVNGSCETPR